MLDNAWSLFSHFPDVYPKESMLRDPIKLFASLCSIAAEGQSLLGGKIVCLQAVDFVDIKTNKYVDDCLVGKRQKAGGRGNISDGSL